MNYSNYRVFVPLLLVIGCIGCGHKNELFVGVRPDENSFPTILRSELQNDQSDSRFCPEFRLRNTLDTPVHILLKDQDCSCYSVQFGDQAWEVDEEFELAAGEQVSVRLNVEPSPLRAWQTWTVNAVARAADRGDEAAVQEIEMTAGMRVLEDLVVSPVVLEVNLPAEPPNEPEVSSLQLIVERIVDDQKLFAQPPRMDGLPEWIKTESIRRIGQPELMTKRYGKQRWQIALAIGHPPTPNRTNVRFPISVAFEPTADEPRIAKSVPVTLRRSVGLSGPSRIVFSEMKLASSRRRRLVVRSLDDRKFSILGVSCSNGLFTVTQLNNAIQPKQVHAMELLVTPNRGGEIADTLVIKTDYAESTIWSSTLEAHVVAPARSSNVPHDLEGRAPHQPDSIRSHSDDAPSEPRLTCEG